MKGFNKKVWLVASILFVMMIGNACATKNNFKSIDNFDEVTKIDINTVVRQYVPAKYVRAFNMATICEDELATANMRLQILAIGYYESGWTKTVCDKPNKDGSLDIGYLQLNSKNIKNKWFMERFGPNYKTSDDLECYLITCINLYKALYSLYGEDAVYAYNAGETRYLRYKSGKSSLPKTTFTYKKWVSKYTKDIFNEMCQAKITREETAINFKNGKHNNNNKTIRLEKLTEFKSKNNLSDTSSKIGIKHYIPYSRLAINTNDNKKKRIGSILLDGEISTKRLSGALSPTHINNPTSSVSSAVVV